MTYSDKLKDPRWQKKRLKILERDQWSCQQCFNDEDTLHIHHKTYITGNEPWEYDDDLLMTVCEECHYYITTEKKAIKEKLDIYFPYIEQIEPLNKLLDILKKYNPADFEDIIILARRVLDQYKTPTKSL